MTGLCWLRETFGMVYQSACRVRTLYETAGDVRFTMNVQRNIEASSCDHCCSGKTITITYSECVFGALGT
jgi:hypothetical protein